MDTEKDELMKLVPSDGKSIGNKSLREKLKWDEDKYWKVRNELIHDGLIRKSTGMGGAVKRVEAKVDDVLPVPPIDQKKEAYKDEKSLYSPFKSTIELKFTTDNGIKGSVCEDISSQGRRYTGGLWTRPDIVLISVNTYPYYPGKVMDVITFELKHHKNISVAGVFETAAQSRFATKSYFCVYLPAGWDYQSEDYERIKNECERFGVGLISFSEPKDYDTWEVLVEPERKEPDPGEISNFISVQLNERSRMKVAELLR